MLLVCGLVLSHGNLASADDGHRRELLTFGCAPSCYGSSCDSWSNTCAELELAYGCDCSGCDCPVTPAVDDDICSATCQGETCDYWVAGDWGYTCSQIEDEMGCDCTGCRCYSSSECYDGDTCCDTNGDHSDQLGEGCADYDATWCGSFDDSDFSSNEMCCRCGGGSLPEAQNSNTEEACLATCGGFTCDYWVMSGYSCGNMEADYGCDCGGCVCHQVCDDPTSCYGYSCDYWLTLGSFQGCPAVENQLGCDCSGCSCWNGIYTTGCADTAGGATDPYGDGCTVYAAFPLWCGGYDDSDFLSLEMCCACGGGGTVISDGGGTVFSDGLPRLGDYDSSCANSGCYGENCDYWTTVGFTCEVLESNYGCDCSSCECHQTPSAAPTDSDFTARTFPELVRKVGLSSAYIEITKDIVMWTAIALSGTQDATLVSNVRAVLRVFPPTWHFSVFDGATLSLEGLTLSGGEATYAGSVWVVGGTLKIKSCAFTNNRATSSAYGGGALYFEASSVGIISGSYFGENSAVGSGGAAWVDETSKVTVSDSRFVANVAGADGGAVKSVSTNNAALKLSISNTTFDSNRATGDGGALHFTGDCENCEFVSNSAENGGAVFSSQSVSLSGGLLANCSASYAGAAVYSSFLTKISDMQVRDFGSSASSEERRRELSSRQNTSSPTTRPTMAPSLAPTTASPTPWTTHVFDHLTAVDARLFVFDSNVIENVEQPLLFSLGDNNLVIRNCDGVSVDDVYSEVFQCSNPSINQYCPPAYCSDLGVGIQARDALPRAVRLLRDGKIKCIRHVCCLPTAVFLLPRWRRDRPASSRDMR